MADKKFPTDLVSKAVPADSDIMLIADSADSNKSKRSTVAQLSAKILADGAVSDKANIVDVLTKTNTDAYTPTDTYHPATKNYVDTNTASISGHIADTGNPHSVTQNQIGLGNVNNTSDADKPVSTAQKDAIINGFVTTVTTSGSYVADLSTYNSFSITISGDFTMENPTTETVMGTGLISIRQDGTGGHTITFGTNWNFPAGAPVINTTADAWNVFRYTVLATNIIIVEFVADFV